ncbi:pectate lyase [Niabella aurantiaca]|uniref:pectate lyase n=1 Tax=Niabella aurantiaca TaxID=379900 RepID=UPI000366C947|nr:pectate lyase [Niabella aurantiaca]
MPVKNIVILCVTALIVCRGLNAQNSRYEPEKNYLRSNWKQLASGAPAEWFASEDARSVAEKLIRTQKTIGGWGKNINYNRLNASEVQDLEDRRDAIGATFDNGATITELKFLARVYERCKDDRYKKAMENGIRYILTAQYKSGGWPQFFPARKGVSYSSHVTYNDNAMVNILGFLKSIDNNERPYSALDLPQDTRLKIRNAIDKGIECILKSQIIVAGKPTVWCAQHDEVTLLPANARAYELASFSGSESAGITLFLMSIADPSKGVSKAVEGAVRWFCDHEIRNRRLKNMVTDAGEKDIIVIRDSTAAPLWARFYDLETGRPFFCGRDGVKKGSIAEIEYERRVGYSWYSGAPSKVLEKYAAWKARR